MNWKGKKIIITGGNSGIGKQLVNDFNKAGASIVFGGLEKRSVQHVSDALGVKGIVADLSIEEQLIGFFNEAIKYLGGVNLLINNAGYVIAEPFENLSRSNFEYMFAINSIAPARLSQLVLPYFKQNGKGDIINVGATGGDYAFKTGTAYSASKAALKIISKNLSLEFREDNIRVFHVDPSHCSDTNNGNYGTQIPKDNNKLNPMDISQLILHILELDRRAFVPELSVWGTAP